VKARGRQRQRVVQVHVNARIGERIAPALARDLAVRREHLGLELDHVDLLDRARHHFDRGAAAEPDDQERAQLRTREHRQGAEPARERIAVDPRTRARDARLGQPFAARTRSAIGQQHGRRWPTPNATWPHAGAPLARSARSTVPRPGGHAHARRRAHSAGRRAVARAPAATSGRFSATVAERRRSRAAARGSRRGQAIEPVVFQA
jgi:hypothetical protein